MAKAFFRTFWIGYVLTTNTCTDIDSVDQQGPSTMINESNQEWFGVSKPKHSVVTRIATTFCNQPSIGVAMASCHHDHLGNPLKVSPKIKKTTLTQNGLCHHRSVEHFPLAREMGIQPKCLIFLDPHLHRLRAAISPDRLLAFRPFVPRSQGLRWTTNTRCDPYLWASCSDYDQLWVRPSYLPHY